jgi:hypothetical protein
MPANPHEETNLWPPDAGAEEGAYDALLAVLEAVEAGP